MPAPRTCRECGAALSPDLRWCGRCLAPITEFAAREIVPGSYVESPRAQVRYSRWQGGPTSFGPVGRVLATILVFLFGPWTFSSFPILFGPIWIVIAVVVLKSIWKKERVVEGQAPSAADRWRQRHERRHPALFKTIGRRWLVGLGLGAIAIGYVYMLMRAAEGWRFLMAAAIVAAALGLFLAWLGDL